MENPWHVEDTNVVARIGTKQEPFGSGRIQNMFSIHTEWKNERGAKSFSVRSARQTARR